MAEERSWATSFKECFVPLALIRLIRTLAISSKYVLCPISFINTTSRAVWKGFSCHLSSTNFPNRVVQEVSRQNEKKMKWEKFENGSWSSTGWAMMPIKPQQCTAGFKLVPTANSTLGAQKVDVPIPQWCTETSGSMPEVKLWTRTIKNHPNGWRAGNLIFSRKKEKSN